MPLCLVGDYCNSCLFIKLRFFGHNRSHVISDKNNSAYKVEGCKPHTFYEHKEAVYFVAFCWQCIQGIIFQIDYTKRDFQHA